MLNSEEFVFKMVDALTVHSSCGTNVLCAIHRCIKKVASQINHFAQDIILLSSLLIKDIQSPTEKIPETSEVRKLCSIFNRAHQSLFVTPQLNINCSRSSCTQPPSLVSLPRPEHACLTLFPRPTTQNRNNV